MENMVEFKNVDKEYVVGDETIFANHNLNFSIKRGEFVVIVGPSGAGKTTLLNLLGGMDKVTRGEIIVDGKDIAKFSNKQLTSFRRSSIGFVFQFYNLVQNMTAYDNIEVSSELVKNAMDTDEVLKMVGLYDRKDNFPSQLSGGEQQRVSIARALAKKPKLLLCDEPTGALDSQTGKEILELFKYLNEAGNTIVMITHDNSIALEARRVVRIADGKITFDGDVKDYAAIL